MFLKYQFQHLSFQYARIDFRIVITYSSAGTVPITRLPKREEEKVEDGNIIRMRARDGERGPSEISDYK